MFRFQHFPADPSRPARRLRLAAGFTVIELLMAITVMTVLTLIAVPGFNAMINNNRIRSDAGTLMANLATARSEAARRGISVTVCASSDGSSCLGTTADPSWVNGYIAFTDLDNNAAYDSSTETILLVNGPLATGLTVTPGSFTTGNRLRFSASGEATLTGTLTLCRSGYSGRVISINNAGRASSKTTTALCS